MFYKYAHIFGPKGSPDMSLRAFDVKFDEKKDEIPSRACRPSKKLKNNNVQEVEHQKVKKSNVEKVDTQKVEKEQCRKSGPPKS